MAAGTTMQHGSIRVKFKNFDLSHESKIVFFARVGIRPSVFYAFAGFIDMSERNLANLLHIHPRTISNYRDQRKKLDPVGSEHLLKLMALFAKGEEIFGTIAEFKYWMDKPFWDTGERPSDWVITPGGVDLVSDELDRLIHGYVI